MKSKLNFLIFLNIILSTIYSSSEKFHGWGSTILHHVGNPESFWAKGILIYPFSKPVVMLFIAAGVTLIMALWGTKQ